MPISGFWLMKSASDIQEWGKEWTKFIVPSTGSIIHVGALVNKHGLPPETDSSPMNLWSGKCFERLSINSFSTAWSVSVTKSISQLFVSTNLLLLKVAPFMS